MERGTKCEDEREDLIQRVGANLYEAMYNENMTVAELSRITGLPETSIRRYARGDALPRLDYLYVIARALGRTVGQLVDDE